MSKIEYFKQAKQNGVLVSTYISCSEQDATCFEYNGERHPIANLKTIVKQNADKDETMPEPMTMPKMNFSADGKEEKKEDKVIGNPMPVMDFNE